MTDRRGITHAIRQKLNFNDDKLWKRFSSRRLELIDTLDLSIKKASEQDREISRVAEVLRIEFNYSLEYVEDFHKLVRAAIQSVRRNRKRSTKTDRAKFKRKKESSSSLSHPSLDEGSVGSEGDQEGSDYETMKVPVNNKPLCRKGSLKREHNEFQFLSEIMRLNSDSHDDVEYSRSKFFSVDDKAKTSINHLTRPKVSGIDLSPAWSASLLNYIEKSKTCSEISTCNTSNLRFIGRGLIIATVGLVFEKCFPSTKEESRDYLRSKLTHELYLAQLYRQLDPNLITALPLTDEVATISLYTILGGCVKDFGFEIILNNVGELLYHRIIKEYPLMRMNSHLFREGNVKESDDKFLELHSLAQVAAEYGNKEKPALGPALGPTLGPALVSTLGPSLVPTPITGISRAQLPEQSKKSVSIKYLSSVLNFTFPTTNSATPKLHELLENIRTAFQMYNDSQVLTLVNRKQAKVISSDGDLEKVFRQEGEISLEVFNQNSHPIPINEITSMVRLNNDKIILPPPVMGQGSGMPPSFKFLSNDEESVPKFQPLL